MRLALTDLFLRIVSRYGMLVLFIVLFAAFLLALRSTFKLTTRPVFSFGILVFLTASLGFIAPAALRSSLRLVQVARAALSVPPAFAGPFAVASATLELAPFSELENADDRPILLHLWYPADRSASNAVHEQDPLSCAQLDATMTLARAPAPYPVVLLAPGFGGTPPELSVVARNLAGHGYLVAGFDDLVRDSPASTASVADEDTRLRTFDFSSADAIAETMRRGSVRVEREALKALDSLNRLERCVQDTAVLRDRIRFTRVGFVGYSFGGAAAAEASFMDPRIAAVVNMDGSQFGRAAEGPVNVPYMMLHSDFDREVLFDPDSPHRYEFMLDQRDLILAAEQSVRPNSHLFVIGNSFHSTFANPSLSLRNLITWLALDPYRAHEIISAYLLGFLDAYLKGDQSRLIGPGDPRYPEVRNFNSQA